MINQKEKKKKVESTYRERLFHNGGNFSLETNPKPIVT